MWRTSLRNGLLKNMTGTLDRLRGGRTGSRRGILVAGGRAGILGRLQPLGGEAALDSVQAGRYTADYLYIAEDGGHLMGYSSPFFFGDPDSPCESWR